MTELSPEIALTNLLDSDAWPDGLAEADPAEAARVICNFLRDSGFAIVDRERVRETLVRAAAALV